MPARLASRTPRWYGILFRAGVITFLGTLLTFVVSLFLGIIGTVVAGVISGRHPDMRFAYRHIALPVAITAACALLIGSLIYETRQYRQSRVLASIARAS